MGGDPAHYALLDNATTAASTVALLVAAKFASGEYQRGDRILVTLAAGRGVIQTPLSPIH
jgi:hypothetical protein